MTDTEVETQPAPRTRESEAKLPWESIDPQEPVSQIIGPRASTATKAVEARKGKRAIAAAISPAINPRFYSIDIPAQTVTPVDEQEEELAAIAFFSDGVATVDAAKDSEEVPQVNVNEEPRSSDNPNLLSEEDDSDEPLVLLTADRMAFDSEGAGLTSELVGSADPTTSEGLVGDTGFQPVPDAIEAKESSASELPTQQTRVENPCHELTLTLNVDSTELVPLALDETPWAGLDGSLAGEIDGPVDAAKDAWVFTADRFAFSSAGQTPEMTADAIAALPVWGADLEPVDSPAEPAAIPQETPTNAAPPKLSAKKEFAVVSRSLSADAVSEAINTFATADSLTAAASELATLAETFTAHAVDQPATATIAVSVAAEEGFAEDYIAQPQAATEAQVDAALDTGLAAPQTTTGGAWTIPLMCLGIGLIACCMVIPQGESNRRLRYEQAILDAEFQQVQKQAAVNDEFLKKVSDDPTLAERLAGRQMKTIRKGQRVLPLANAAGDGDMSPFGLTRVPPPAPLPPYHAKTGTIANLCNNVRSRLYLLGASLAMVATGLVLGLGETRKAI